jgi:prepilin-type N-terminal cleavage/methylation domain-containing protein
MNTSPLMTIRYGFTLIEMMISIALGSLIVYTAIAGFRVASTSVTLVNRLALENAIMRSGIEQAHDRVDFWTDTDNPEDISQQGLRNNSSTAGLNTPERRAADAASGSYTSGLPFSDMIDVFPLSPNPPPIPITTEAARESIKGWNPQDRWLMNESRTWFHGDLSDNANYGAKPGGYYSVFTNAKNSVTVQTRVNTLSSTTPPTVTSTVITPVAVTPPHNWLMGQTRGMHQALGFYAFADYMPANHVYGVYTAPKIPTRIDQNGNLAFYFGPTLMPWLQYEYELDDPLLTDENGTLLTLVVSWSRFTQVSQWCATSSDAHYVRTGGPQDLGRLTQGGVFAMVSPGYGVTTPVTTPNAVAFKINSAKNPLMHQFKYAVGHSPEMNGVSAMDYNQGNITAASGWAQQYDLAGAGQFQRFLNVTEMTTEVIPGGGPAQWPKATVSMKRYVTESRFVNLCSLRWTSPVTGASAELNFTTFGTSLRGARQQRASQPMSASAAAGWAKWYGPGDSNNSLTLDGKL